nr:Gfo/Idh/MocA family oxidoreductase [Paenibacillus antri]
MWRSWSGCFEIGPDLRKGDASRNRSAIRSGEIGKLTSITASLYQEWREGTANSWRQDPSLSGGGFLMDSGSHIIDVLLWTTGLTPVEVKTQLHRQGSPVEIDTFSSIRFAEGAVAGLNLVGHAPCWHETYVFCGEAGGIFYDNGKITLRKAGEEPIVPKLPEPATNQDKSFIDAILGRHEVMVPGEFALKVGEAFRNGLPGCRVCAARNACDRRRTNSIIGITVTRQAGAFFMKYSGKRKRTSSISQPLSIENTRGFGRRTSSVGTRFSQRLRPAWK